MRNSEQMMKLILEVAEHNEHIRAVAMNGSRVNPSASADCFQDYDIVYIVDQLESFIHNHSWVEVFGEMIIMQMPEAGKPLGPASSFMYLMQLADGNRIDLRLLPKQQVNMYVQEDKLTVTLLDKDHIMPKLQQPADTDYHVKRPQAQQFADCCNQFWWVSTYIAKGLWRKEILYAVDHLNLYVRPELIRMLNWQVGAAHGFAISTGKSSKYLQHHLPDAVWEHLLRTYPQAQIAAIWEAVFQMTDLFEQTAPAVAEQLGLMYNHDEADRVKKYLHHIHQLPEDAQQIY